MFIGIVIFALAALLVIGGFVVMMNKRKDYESGEAPEDQLSDEDFRRIEFGDDV